MLMPIVSMNKMAMNESVAATCCYIEHVAATNVYWEVLHGGWIGSGYVMKTVKRTGFDVTAGKWSATFPLFDVDGATDGNYPEIIKTTSPDGDVSYTINGGAYKDLMGWLYDADTDVSVGRSCTHTEDASCKYYDFHPDWEINQHFEATSKHDTGGSGWAKPHGAKQWAS